VLQVNGKEYFYSLAGDGNKNLPFPLTTGECSAGSQSRLLILTSLARCAAVSLGRNGTQAVKKSSAQTTLKHTAPAEVKNELKKGAHRKSKL